jgi:hypothetical protein
MGYQFAGFFAQPALVRPDSLPQHAAWREIDTPFTGVGVRLPALIGRTPPPGEVQALARQLGLHAAASWLYLTYDSWGGRIDFVYGLGSRGDVPFGPVEEDNVEKVEAAYIDLMGQLGVSAEGALRFAPFERGYWGGA